MSAPRTVHLDLALPALTPAEADLLWSFLQDLSQKLWDAYEPQLLATVNEDLLPPDPLDP